MKDSISSALGFKTEIVWRNVILFIILNSAFVYGAYLCITGREYFLFTYTFIVMAYGAYGVTVGAHRLWAHKSFKATLPLRIFLMFLQTLAFQNCIHEWVRDHRVHHKHVDTDADPHNAKRGFFFSHMGWLMMKKHPDVIAKGKTIILSDLEEDGVVMFQKKYYLILVMIISFVLPALPPYLLWGYSFKTSFYICSLMRYNLSLHLGWLINSAAHKWGTRPYDKNVTAVNMPFKPVLLLGESWHNYHHAFPWDYKASEIGKWGGGLNYSALFVDICAVLGQAYDLKTVSDELMLQRCLRTGDGSHTFSKMAKTPLTFQEKDALLNTLDPNNKENTMWGWGDHEMPEEERKLITILNRNKS